MDHARRVDKYPVSDRGFLHKWKCSSQRHRFVVLKSPVQSRGCFAGLVDTP